MGKINYKVKIPSEVIDRGNKFIECHPGVGIEDYLKAQVVIFLKCGSSLSEFDRREKYFFEREMSFAFNPIFVESLKSISKVERVSECHYINDACIEIDKELFLDNKDVIRRLNLILSFI